MDTIDTAGNEHVLVSHAGEDAVLLAVHDPYFGRIATVRLDNEQAFDLAVALSERILDATA